MQGVGRGGQRRADCRIEKDSADLGRLFKHFVWRIFRAGRGNLCTNLNGRKYSQNCTKQYCTNITIRLNLLTLCIIEDDYASNQINTNKAENERI
jgi:hypothetical protein